MGTHGYGTHGGSKKPDNNRDDKALTKAAERQLREYFKRTLYKHLVECGFASDVQTDVSADMDKKGVDIILIGPDGKPQYADEKGQFKYLNRPTMTWSFELLYRNKYDRWVDGWLLQCDPESEDPHLTDYFALSYIDQTTATGLADFTADKIQRVSTLFVKVSDLEEWLDSRGKDYNELGCDADDALDAYNERIMTLLNEGIKSEQAWKEASLFFDPAYKEMTNGYQEAHISVGVNNLSSNAVNLIVSRDILRSLPHSREFVSTPDRVWEKNIHEPRYNVSYLKEMEKRGGAAFTTDTEEKQKSLD